jgi:hypothetical protein
MFVTITLYTYLETSSSVSIAFDYTLDDRAIGVRSPAEERDFSSILCVQTSSEAHSASYPMGTGVLSEELKHGRGVTLTTHPHLVPRSRMSRSYTSSPPSASVVYSGTALLFYSLYLLIFILLVSVLLTFTLFFCL